MICLPPNATYPDNLQEWRQMCHSHPGHVILPTQVCPGCPCWIHFEGSFDSQYQGTQITGKGGPHWHLERRKPGAASASANSDFVPIDTRTAVCSSLHLCPLSGSGSGVSLSFPSYYRQVPPCILELPVLELKD